jgi:DsbC/DsbD-like thiol-disulfide interchange protein
MKIALSTTLAVVLLSSLGPAPAAGQAKPPQAVAWAMTLAEPATPIEAGGTFEAILTVKIDEGWHVYAVDQMPDGPRPLLIALAEKSPFRAGGALKAPAAEREMDESFGQLTAFYKTDSTFRLQVLAPPDLAAGARDLVVDVAFQACDGRICLPGRVTRLKTSVTITR